MTRVRITSGEYCFIADLLEKEAPKTCEAFKKMLPLKSEMIHVRWSGEGVWIPYGDLRLGLYLPMCRSIRKNWHAANRYVQYSAPL